MAKKRKEKVKEEVQEEVASKKQVKEENKILRNFFIGIAIFAVLIIAFIVISNELSKFEYEGVDFEIVKFCDAGPPCLVVYKTTLPVKAIGNNIIVSSEDEKNADYNIYLRNDPREMNVSFTGELVFSKSMVLNSEESFICDGKGAIAAANLIQLYEILGTKVISDESASCDNDGRYVYVNVRKGNETSVDQFGPGCYNIDINNCEILEGTERLMLQALIEFNKELNK